MMMRCWFACGCISATHWPTSAFRFTLANTRSSLPGAVDPLSLGTNAIKSQFMGMSALSNWPRNRLLLALPSRNLKRLMPELWQVRCEREQILMDADSSLDHVFFPDSGIVSVLAGYADGYVIDMLTFGEDGCSHG